jgi:hypothetical protein
LLDSAGKKTACLPGTHQAVVAVRHSRHFYSRHSASFRFHQEPCLRVTPCSPRL